MRTHGRAILAVGAALALLGWPGEVLAAAQRGCRLWAQAVMPGLFPFMVCMLYATGNLQLGGGRGWRGVGLTKGGAGVWLMGLMTGSPGGARLLAEAWERGMLSRREALRLAVYTGTMSPMFIMGTLGLWMGSPQTGPRLLAAHWLGVFCAGQLARLVPGEAGTEPARPAALPPPMTLSRAVEGACQSMLYVCGCMVMGCVAADLFSALCPGLPPAVFALTQCLLEVTAGCQALLAAKLPPWLLAGAVSLGGLSLFLQNLAFYPRRLFSLGWAALGRLAACLLSLAFGWALFQFPLPVFAQALRPLPAPSPWLLWGFVGLTALSLAVNLGKARE